MTGEGGDAGDVGGGGGKHSSNIVWQDYCILWVLSLGIKYHRELSANRNINGAGKQSRR